MVIILISHHLSALSFHVDHPEYLLHSPYPPSPGEGGTWVNFCWVCATGLSEPLPHYSLFCGQL